MYQFIACFWANFSDVSGNPAPFWPEELRFRKEMQFAQIFMISGQCHLQSIILVVTSHRVLGVTSSTFHILSLDYDHTPRHQLTTEDNMYHSPSISDGFWPFWCGEVEACWRISKTVTLFFLGGENTCNARCVKTQVYLKIKRHLSIVYQFTRYGSQLAFQLLADTSIAFFLYFSMVPSRPLLFQSDP